MIGEAGGRLHVLEIRREACETGVQTHDILACCAGPNHWQPGTRGRCACAGVLPELSLDVVTYAILGASTAIKVALLAYCWALRGQSDSMLALAEDHSNDVVSNLGGSPEP